MIARVDPNPPTVPMTTNMVFSISNEPVTVRVPICIDANQCSRMNRHQRRAERAARKKAR